jgi:hypothetical protein
MNKKLSTLLALIFCLAPLPVMADNPHQAQGVTVKGNNFFQGAVTATNLNPKFEVNAQATQNGPFDFVDLTAATIAMVYTMSTNADLVALPTTQTNPPTFAALQLTGFEIECSPYNPAFVPNNAYPYFIESNGIAGGTVTFSEYNSTGPAVVIGTLVMPSSPHNGPYINTAQVTLNSLYTPTSGSIIDAHITSIDAGHSQGYSNCVVTAVLQ